MPLGGPSLADVNQEAHRLIEERAKERGIPLDASAAETAELVPAFSKGTTALDPNTGDPIIGQGKPSAEITGEAGGPVDAMAAAEAEISGTPEPKPSKKRDDKTGKFVKEPAQDATQGSAPQAQAPQSQEVAPDEPQAAATEAAAEAIAAEAPDPWEAFEEIEYEDPTLEKKFKVRVPKDDAKLIKGGYMRQSDYSRKTMQLAAARNALLPLIEDGSIANVLPLIQMGVKDREFAQFVAEAAQRRARGEPLTPAQAAVTTPAATPPAVAPDLNLGADADPFMAQVLKETLTPYKQQLDEVQSLVRSVAATEEQRVAAQQAAQRENDRRIGIMVQSHQALAQWFPGEFTGDINQDGELFQRVANYARESGFAQAYPDNPLAMAMAWRQYHDSRADAASSPAVAAVEQAAVERKVALSTAAAIPSGSPQTAPSRKAPPQPPQTRVNGVPVPPKQYAESVIAYRRALAASQQQ